MLPNHHQLNNNSIGSGANKKKGLQRITIEAASLLPYTNLPSNTNTIVNTDDGVDAKKQQSNKHQSIMNNGLDKKVTLYKTEMCRTLEETGQCRYGPRCQFAHDKSELRQVSRHPRYKTEICNTFWREGTCPYGKRCCFIHTEQGSLITNNDNKEHLISSYVANPVLHEQIPRYHSSTTNNNLLGSTGSSNRYTAFSKAIISRERRVSTEDTPRSISNAAQCNAVECPLTPTSLASEQTSPKQPKSQSTCCSSSVGTNADIDNVDNIDGGDNAEEEEMLSGLLSKDILQAMLDC